MTTFNPPAGTKLNVIIDSSLQGEGKRIQYYWVYLVDQGGATREGRLRVNEERFEFAELVENVISEGRTLDNGNFTCSMPSQPTPQPEPENLPCPEGHNSTQDLVKELEKALSYSVKDTGGKDVEGKVKTCGKLYANMHGHEDEEAGVRLLAAKAGVDVGTMTRHLLLMGLNNYDHFSSLGLTVIRLPKLPLF
jgi:hypothetical protein